MSISNINSLSVTCDWSVVTTNKTDRNDIAELHVLLKVALNTINQNRQT